MRSRLTRRAARARAILIAGAIAVAAVLPLASPAAARPAAPASPVTTCADQILLHGSFGDVTVTPGHWCVIGFSTVTGNIDVTGATSFNLFASAVGGNVTITGTTSHPGAAVAPGLGSANSICTSGIFGNLTISGSSPAAPWNISGTNYPPYVTFANCAAQIFVAGTVEFNDNAGSPNEIGGADIEGNLECSGNGTFTTGVLTAFQKDGVDGATSGQCARFAVKGDNPGIFPGPPPWLLVDPDGPGAG